jgi:deoxyribodipyrimidine photo-lyase
MADTSPVIFWFRRDLRLSDNPALTAACESGAVVIPVFVMDDESPGIWKTGAASRWWLHHSLTKLSAALDRAGFHPLVVLSGNAEKIIPDIAARTGAGEVYWNRRYEPWAMQRDTRIKQTLKQNGVDGSSFNGYLMFEPWEIKNKTGGPYMVYTPFSKTCFDMPVRPVIDKKPRGKFTRPLLDGMTVDGLKLLPAIKWYGGMEKFWQPGEAGGQARLTDFVRDGMETYKLNRDFPADDDGISRLSPHLHFGEISPHQAWYAAAGGKNAFAWQRQLIWREFSYHLLYHAPDFPEKPWNPQFAKFPWARNKKHFDAWKRGRTGYPIIDAGMRQLWETGWMHNRVRMIVGSFLVKNLLLHWRDGEDWFWDTLVDADLGNNAAGWQWIAGCGADAAPYFRIFNPLLQSRKFDPDGDYIRRYVPELADVPSQYIHAPWEAPPLIRAQIKNYPDPIIDLASSRDRALEAYAQSKSAA